MSPHRRNDYTWTETQAPQGWSHEKAIKETISTALRAKNKTKADGRVTHHLSQRKARLNTCNATYRQKCRTSVGREGLKRWDTIQTSQSVSRDLKAVYGPSKSGRSPLLLSEPDQRPGRTRGKNPPPEHFSNLLIRASTVEPDVLLQIPQLPVLDALNLAPSADEIKKGI